MPNSHHFDPTESTWGQAPSGARPVTVSELGRLETKLDRMHEAITQLLITTSEFAHLKRQVENLDEAALAAARDYHAEIKHQAAQFAELRHEVERWKHIFIGGWLTVLGAVWILEKYHSLVAG